MPPSNTWTIEEIGPNEYDVLLGNRRQRTYVDLFQAIRHIQDRYVPGQKVIRVEPDGYRTNVTSHFARGQATRRGW